MSTPLDPEAIAELLANEVEQPTPTDPQHKSLDKNSIAQLLAEESQRPSRGGRRRVDPTEDRSLNGWFAQQHHICGTECIHRTLLENPTAKVVVANLEDGSTRTIVDKLGAPCWNPNCLDETRNKLTDRGVQIVVEVKGQYICRYCYLAEYLK